MTTNGDKLRMTDGGAQADRSGEPELRPDLPVWLSQDDCRSSDAGMSEAVGPEQVAGEPMPPRPRTEWAEFGDWRGPFL